MALELTVADPWSRGTLFLRCINFISRRLFDWLIDWLITLSSPLSLPLVFHCRLLLWVANVMEPMWPVCLASRWKTTRWHTVDPSRKARSFYKVGKNGETEHTVISSVCSTVVHSAHRPLVWSYFIICIYYNSRGFLLQNRHSNNINIYIFFFSSFVSPLRCACDTCLYIVFLVFFYHRFSVQYFCWAHLDSWVLYYYNI